LVDISVTVFNNLFHNF